MIGNVQFPLHPDFGTPFFAKTRWDDNKEFRAPPQWVSKVRREVVDHEEGGWLRHLEPKAP